MLVGVDETGLADTIELSGCAGGAAWTATGEVADGDSAAIFCLSKAYFSQHKRHRQ